MTNHNVNRIYDCIVGISYILLWFATFHFLIPEENIAWNYIIYGLLIPITLHYTKIHSKKNTKSSKRVAMIFSILMSFGLTIGFSIARTHDLELCIGSTRAFIIWCLKLLLYSYIIYKITLYLIIKAEDKRQYSYTSKRHPLSNKKLFLIFFASKIPYLILFYPCVWDWDDVIGINSFAPSHILSNWHPFCISLLQKIFFDFGCNLGEPSIGLALFTIILFLAVSAIMVYTIRIIGNLGLNIKYQTILIILFSLFPLYPLISMRISKDGIFAYFIMLYVITLLDIQIRNKRHQQINSKLLLANSLAALFICFSRHQGIYFIIIQFVMIIFIYKKLLKKWCITYIPVFLVYFTTVHIIYPIINVTPTSKGEMYGILFQQSAFSFIQNPQRISTQEKIAFKNITDIDPDTIEQSFTYYCTDKVKQKYKFYSPSTYVKMPLCARLNYSKKGEKEAIRNYLKTYITTLKNTPYYCILAELNIVNQYFFNDYNDFLSNKDTRRFLWSFSDWKNNPYLSPETNFYANTSLYNTINELFRQLSWLPITEFIFSWFLYSWAVILCFIVLLHRKDIYGLTSLMPCFLSISVLFICPLAHFRYFLPIIVLFPILIIYMYHPDGTTIKQTNNCCTDSMLQ